MTIVYTKDINNLTAMWDKLTILQLDTILIQTEDDISNDIKSDAESFTTEINRLKRDLLTEYIYSLENKLGLPKGSTYYCSVEQCEHQSLTTMPRLETITVKEEY